MAEGEPEAVSYEMLQDLLRQERRSNKLSVVAARFWLEVREYLTKATDQFRTEQARDPFGRQVMLLTDQVKNARHAAESLWALRERKLAMLALAASRERRRPDGLTPEEADLYGRLVADLESSRRLVFEDLPVPSNAPVQATDRRDTRQDAVERILAASEPRPTPLPLEGMAPRQPGPPVQAAPASPAPPAASPAAVAARDSPLQMPIEAPVAVPSDTKGPAEPLVTIRALGDIPPFVGPDMQTYLLKEGDIATVPPTIANLLVRRQKAAVLDL